MHFVFLLYCYKILYECCIHSAYNSYDYYVAAVKIRISQCLHATRPSLPHMHGKCAVGHLGGLMALVPAKLPQHPLFDLC